ncbi:MAG: hypothetical protein AAFW46_09895 [Pseudomonadota bacterium]
MAHTATLGRSGARRSHAALTVLVACALAGMVAGAARSEDLGRGASDPCAVLDAAATPTPQALTACRLARETAWGADDPRLIALYDRIAERLRGSQKDAAIATPYRRRAYELSTRLHGESDPQTALAALDYARSWILSGRCEPHDPRVGALIDRARAGFSALPDDAPERVRRLEQTAFAYADALRYGEAAETFASAGDGLSSADWAQIGAWRERAGEAEGAEAAYLMALERAPDRRAADRPLRALKRIYFAEGALGKAQALEARTFGSPD